MRHDEVLMRLREKSAFLRVEAEMGPLLDLSNMIITKRCERGMSRRDLAIASGLNVRTIAKIEDGLVRPRTSTIHKILAVLKTVREKQEKCTLQK